MRVDFLGDIHGDISTIKWQLTSSMVQVGDFHLAGYDEWDQAFYEKNLGRDIKVSVDYTFPYPMGFVCGNHDNFKVLNPDGKELQRVAKNLFYIPRGFVSGKVLFIGGADSIDADRRIPGWDWFPEESISQQQFYRIIEIDKPIEVIVSHDAPLEYLYKIRKLRNIHKKPSQLSMQQIFYHFKPKLWIHGHYHVYSDLNYNDCRFISLDVNQVMNFDVPIDKSFFLKMEEIEKKCQETNQHGDQ